MTDAIQQFASDNYAGICPEAWAAMDAANRGHAPAYGEDAWTARAADAFRALFATDCDSTSRGGQACRIICFPTGCSSTTEGSTATSASTSCSETIDSNSHCDPGSSRCTCICA